MATTYKLSYFNVKGRAELSRLLFAAAGVDYTDHRIPGSDWPALKPTMPFLQLPVLEINGEKVYAQSFAIANYLANEFQLHGNNNEERLQIDQILELLKDFIFYLSRSFKEPDNDKKAEYMKEAVEVHSLTYLKYLEELIKQNDSGYFVGSKLSLADLAVFDIMDWITDRNDTALEHFPMLSNFKEKIACIDNIKNYLARRKN